jgi:hypothetical protein
VRVGVVPHIFEFFFDKGYNFVLDLTSIRDFDKKLWASKVIRVPIARISGFPTWESWEK